MKIGIPKEKRKDEYRVSILPSGVNSLVSLGHSVFIEKGAGLASGISDGMYVENGAEMVNSTKEVFDKADLVYKVKDIIEEEFSYLREGQILTGYYQTQERPELTKFLSEKKAVVFSYERAKNIRGEFPFLFPMSDIAGKLAALMGCYHLFNTNGGKGILIGGYPGVDPANVMILGAGNSGMGALRYVYGLGAQVTIMDRNFHKLKYIAEAFPGVKTSFINKSNLTESLKETDLLINSLRYRGSGSIITREMLKFMKSNSVIVDADALEKGAIETSRETSFSNPFYYVEGIKHIVIPNYPSAVAHTASIALSNATMPFIIELASKGWVEASRDNLELKSSLTLAEGFITYEYPMELSGLIYKSVEELLSEAVKERA